jgi:hypothetical protein
MENNSSYLEDLKIIRKVMEDSSRFLTLSGLSGIFAGICALAGAAFAWFVTLDRGSILSGDYLRHLSEKEIHSIRIQILADGLIVLLLAIASALFFSFRKAKKTGDEIWKPVSKRMLLNLMIPLFTGGIFIIALLINNQTWLIVPSMLLFYGLSLVNAGKFTFGEIFYLGILEIVTGLFSLFIPAWGLFFWSFGFGFLHIMYGLIMFRKYEK